MNYAKTHLRMAIAVLLLWGCTEPFERSGYVIDKTNKEPLPGVSVEIYMKYQIRDSLNEKVFTDGNGYFHIKEKRDKKTLFDVYKPGYIGFVSALPLINDTIYLERESRN